MANNFAVFSNGIRQLPVVLIKRSALIAASLVLFFFSCNQRESVKDLKAVKAVAIPELVADSITYEFLNFLLANGDPAKISSDAKLADGEFNSFSLINSEELDSVISRPDGSSSLSRQNLVAVSG